MVMFGKGIVEKLGFIVQNSGDSLRFVYSFKMLLGTEKLYSYFHFIIRLLE